MIKAKDLESLADAMEHLGLPFREIISLKQIDKSINELNLNIRNSTDTESATYRFCIQKEGAEQYVIHDYIAKMIVVSIQHGFFEGVNTLDLEKQMREINWPLLPLYKNETLFGIFEKLDVLRHSGDRKAIEIAEQLSLRYISNCPLAEILPLPDRTLYEKSIIIPINNDGNDVDIYQAIQLLKGESFIKYVDINNENSELCWLKEDKGYLKVYPDFDIGEILKKMPLAKRPEIIEESEILSGLGKGKSYSTSLIINNRIVEGRISVDPIIKDLIFQTNLGELVKWRTWIKLDQMNKKPGKGKRGPGL